MKIHLILLAIALGLIIAACSSPSESNVREDLVCNGEVRLTREIGEFSVYDSSSRSFEIKRGYSTVGIYTVKVGETCRFVPSGSTTL